MKIAVEHLKIVSSELLKALGAKAHEAQLLSEHLVSADIRGVSTHGVIFLPIVAKRIQKGLIQIPTMFEVILNKDAITHIDGGNGLGQVAVTESMHQAIKKAKRFGISFSLIKNTNHIGLLANYSLMAAEKNMVGFCMTNCSAAMAPWGGVEAFFGTNPFSIAVPGGSNPPIVLDMSTSVVARGKIRQAEKNNQKIPLGWAFDSRGNPTDDPQEALKGTLLPIGGPKGYGMALFIDLICGLISGSKYSRDLLTFHKPLGPTGIGAMTMAIELTHFITIDRYNKQIDEYIDAIRGSAKAEGSSRIYLPGEIEKEKEDIIRKSGVKVKSSLVQSINKLLKEMNLSIRLEDGEIK